MELNSETYIRKFDRVPVGPHYFPARAVQKFIVGVDLGQSSDPTAICVLEHARVPSRNWKVQEREGAPRITRQLLEERFDVRHLQRLPLGMSYPDVCQHVADLLARPPLCGAADLVIDETGVGRAVGDIFEAAGMRPQRIVITAGNETSYAGNNRHHVAKGILISTLDARLHTGELKFASDLREAETMRDELKDFRRKVSVAGRYSYEARVGKHDDLVLAVAIALWWAVRPPPPTLTVQNYGIGFDIGSVIDSPKGERKCQSPDCDLRCYTAPSREKI